MSDELYKLNQAGMDARDELLGLLGYRKDTNKKKKRFGRYNTSKIKQELHLSLDGRTILERILLTPAEGVPPNKLKDFFMHLIERVADRYQLERCNDVCKIIDISLKKHPEHNLLISNHRLMSYFVAYRTRNRQDKDNWELPDNIYDIACKEDSEEIYSKSVKPKSRSTDNRQTLLDLLGDLDYERQEEIFYDRLNEAKQCISFSIVAPCTTTQKWILNRLMTKAIHRTTGRQLSAAERSPFTIDLKKSNVRNSFDEFLRHLSDHFDSDPDSVIKDICQIESDLPLIFVISEFRSFNSIKKRIFKDFWQVINDDISTQTKIIMFWVDECHPCEVSNGIMNLALLDPLDKITLTDIQRWAEKNRRFNMFPKTLLPENLCPEKMIQDTLLKSNWDWHDPWQILDNICKKFNLNGMTDIESLWK